MNEQPQPAPEAGSPEKSASWVRVVMDLLETILLAAALFLAINALSARVRVDGFSMNPTLKDGEFVLVNRLAYRLGEPERGDIVVFHYPPDPSQDLIKRVIGLPGDNIRIEDGQVWVNETLVAEPYIAASPLYRGDWRIPAGNLFVLGDNRNDSSDSHSWGMLPLENVIGKAVLVYWPLYEWNLIEHFDIVRASQ
jgi:signal peptidase I